MSRRDGTALIASTRSTALAIIAALTTACVQHAGPAGGQLRGVGAGWRTEPSVRSPKLTAPGATVQVVAAPSAGCSHIGYVTGVAKRLAPRPTGLSRAEWDAKLPWDEANNDARNLAGAHGAAEIVVDAYETQERRSEYVGSIAFSTFVLVHSRAFRCSGTSASR